MSKVNFNLLALSLVTIETTTAVEQLEREIRELGIRLASYDRDPADTMQKERTDSYADVLTAISEAAAILITPERSKDAVVFFRVLSCLNVEDGGAWRAPNLYII